MKSRDRLRIGAGAGTSDDRGLEPALELAERGEIDYLVFECLAERTIARENLARSKDPELGYTPSCTNACAGAAGLRRAQHAHRQQHGRRQSAAAAPARRAGTAHELGLRRDRLSPSCSATMSARSSSACRNCG